MRREYTFLPDTAVLCGILALRTSCTILQLSVSTDFYCFCFSLHNANISISFCQFPLLFLKLCYFPQTQGFYVILNCEDVRGKRPKPRYVCTGAVLWLNGIFHCITNNKYTIWEVLHEHKRSCNRLKFLRAKANYTQSYVCSKIHLSRSSYSNYENGLRVPPLDILKLLAEFYDTSLDYLVGMTDCPEKYPFASAEMYLLFATCQDMASPALNEVLSYACYRKQMEKH